jgi:DNA-binding XRE family transcriptional regulator
MSESLLSGAALRRRLEPICTLREVRVSACLTHEELARRAGVALRTVRNAERGIYAPRLATRAKLARALGVLPSTISWPAPDHEPPSAV